MATTTRLSLRYPVASDTADVPRDIGNLASDIDKAAIFSKGTFSARPTSTVGSPGIDGRYYFATDTSRLYLDTGTSWVEVASGDSSVTSAMIADGAIVNADVNASAAIAYSKLNLTNSVVAGDLTTDSVTAAKIKDGEIGSSELAATLADILGITNGSNTRRGSVVAATERTVNSTSYQDVTGVSLTIDVASPSVTIVGYRAELKNSSGSGFTSARALVGTEPIETSIGSGIDTAASNTDYLPSSPSIDTAIVAGTTYRGRAVYSFMPSSVSGTGSKTVKLQFVTSTNHTGYIKNCALYAFNIAF